MLCLTFTACQVFMHVLYMRILVGVIVRFLIGQVTMMHARDFAMHSYLCYLPVSVCQLYTKAGAGSGFALCLVPCLDRQP